MKFKFKTQKYQQNAVENICDAFEGQPFADMMRYTMDLGVRKEDNLLFERSDEGFENAKILLDESDILNNINIVQQRCNYKLSESLIKGLGKCTLDIEMETGTGKTYVYIKTIFELNKRYGWSKFVIVVPSIAIREGVNKSFQMMEDHFMEQYSKKAKFFIYNSKRLEDVQSFASSNSIQIMIINVQAFNARGVDARRFDMVLDDFQSRSPKDVLAKTRPILILDEPQKMGGDATQESFRKFNALFSLNFSATHKKQHNIIYSLDAIDAYNQSLVKKIKVKGFEIVNIRGTDGYLYLQDIIVSPKKPPMAKLEFEIKYNKSTNRETRILKNGENLYYESNELEQYNNCIISDINASSGYVEFTNGEILKIGQGTGQIDEKNLRKIQIRETIKSHFQKEEELFKEGIKCLSLFFIDEVKKYRCYDEKGNEIASEYGEIFEKEYLEKIKEYESKDTEYANYLKKINVKDTHKGYFSIDKKTGHAIDSRDNKETGSDDISAYDLILKNKERLLSFEEPTRFIFSHSALREGWDNPNVFQICVLKHGGDSSIAKRQEVGRGLRIAVNKYGERCDLNYFNTARNIFLKINCLTVIATDSYEKFVADIQKDIEINLADRPKKANKEYFIGKVISDGISPIQIPDKQATIIYQYLLKNEYIDENEKITEKYASAKDSGIFCELAEELQPYTADIHHLIQSVYNDYDIKDMYGNDNQTKTENNLNENFEKFKTLWNEINHKYIYRVEFKSEELIQKSVNEIDEKLVVSKLRYNITEGEQKKELDENQIKRGDSFGNEHSSQEIISVADSIAIKYDLIGKIKKDTELTRKTIATILQKISPSKFNLFKENPEEFISKVSKFINEQKATMFVNHIEYNKLDEKYDSEIFTANQSNIDFKKAIRTKKAIQDYIETDGTAENSVEKRFAENLEKFDQVCVYAKLPKLFKIPTPVGNYSPDWAISFNDSKDIKHIYFIAETKGSMDSFILDRFEKIKTDCAKQIFNKQKLSEKVRYGVVDDFKNLIDVMNNIE